MLSKLEYIGMSTLFVCYCDLFWRKWTKYVPYICVWRDMIHFPFIIYDLGNVFDFLEKSAQKMLHICAQRDRVHGDVNTSRIPLTPLSLAANKHWECASTALKTSKWINRHTETKTSRETKKQTFKQIYPQITLLWLTANKH